MSSVASIDLLDASDEKLLEISMEGQLALNLIEMKAIKEHYSKMGRDPTDVELETFAQTWSEHCMHKTFCGNITMDGGKIENLLKSTVARVTNELNHSWCFLFLLTTQALSILKGMLPLPLKWRRTTTLLPSSRLAVLRLVLAGL